MRFHAAQSIAVFGGLQVIYIMFGILFGTVGGIGARLGLFSLASAVIRMVELVGVVLWILLMVKAVPAREVG